MEQQDIKNADVFPSEIIRMQATISGKPVSVLIPADEKARFAEIFQAQVYSILPFRRNKNMTIVDIGANIGLFSIYASFLAPGTEIYCFEPAPQTRSLLEQNLASFKEIRIFPTALSNRNGQDVMLIDSQSTGRNTMKAERIQNKAGEIQIQTRDAGEMFDELAISQVDALKIDTEGCEVEILESLGRRLDNIDYILLEYHTERDRRKIDSILRNFTLFAAESTRIGFGVNKYINRSLLKHAGITDNSVL